jgi:hypothetical protein
LAAVKINRKNKKGFLLTEIIIALFFFTIFVYIFYSFCIQNFITMKNLLAYNKEKVCDSLVLDLIVKDIVSTEEIVTEKDNAIFKKVTCNDKGKKNITWIMWSCNNKKIVRKSGNYNFGTCSWNNSNTVSFNTSYTSIDFKTFYDKKYKDLKTVNVLLYNTNKHLVEKMSINPKNTTYRYET